MSVAVPLHVTRQLGEANMLYAMGDFQNAVSLLLEVVRLCPRLPHPYETLGVIYEQERQKKKALQLYLMAANLSKRDASHWRRLASLAAEVGENEQTLFCLSKVLSLVPDDIDAMWEQGRLHVQLGQHRKAAAVLASILPQRPRDVQVVHYLAQCYLQLGEREHAIEMLSHVLGSLLAQEQPSNRSPEPPTDANPGTAPTTHGAPIVASSSATSAHESSGHADSQRTAEGRARAAHHLDTFECALHLTNMLLELLIERGSYAEGVARVASLRAVGWVDLPIEICVKEGVCHAYLGNVAQAESVWRPLLEPLETSHSEAAGSHDGCDDGVEYKAEAAPAEEAPGARLSQGGPLDKVDFLLYEVAKVFSALSLHHRALLIYDRLLGSARYGSAVHLRRGECLDALRRDAEAVTAFSQALAGKENTVDALLAACTLHLRQGKPSQVIDLMLAHGCIDTQTATGSSWASGSGDGEAAGGAEGRVILIPSLDSGHSPGCAKDVRLIALRGCAFSDLGRHEEAIALLQPLQEACARLLEPRSMRRRRATVGDAEERRGRKRLKLSAGGELVPVGDDCDSDDIAGDGDGDGCTTALTMTTTTGREQAQEALADVVRRLDGSVPPGASPHVAAAAAAGVLAARQLDEEIDTRSTHVLGSEELWTAMTMRLAHSLWAVRGPADAYVQLDEATAIFLLPCKQAQPYFQLDPRRLSSLRVLLAKLACAIGQPHHAYNHVHQLCVNSPQNPSLWTLFHFVSSRARFNRPDERWTLRLLMRNPESAQLTLATAHRCLLSRSFLMAMAEYAYLLERFPQEPLLPLCIAMCNLQIIMSRKNQHRGHSALVGLSWMQEYARRRGPEYAQEVAFNLGRAYHHVGMTHLAVPLYIEVLLRVERDSHAARGDTASSASNVVGKDLTLEAAHNLACLCSSHGNSKLASQIVRTYMRV